MGEVLAFPMERVRQTYDVLPQDIVQWTEEQDGWKGVVELAVIEEEGYSIKDHFIIEDSKFRQIATIVHHNGKHYEVDAWDYICDGDDICVRVLNYD